MTNFNDIKNKYVMFYSRGLGVNRIEQLFNTELEAKKFFLAEIVEIKDIDNMSTFDIESNYNFFYNSYNSSNYIVFIEKVENDVLNYEKYNEYSSEDGDFKNRKELITSLYYWLF